MHTYTIGHYNPSVKIIDLVSHHYVVCVNFILRTTDFLENFLWQFYLLSEILPDDV